MFDELPTIDQLNKAIQEREYYEFFKAAWPILEPTTPLQDNWHIKYLCDTLQSEIERIAAGKPKTKDIIINIPPRSLKSSITTITLNAWAWARYPHLRFIAASYASDLAIELATKTRRLVDSTWYQKNWGNVFQLSDDQNTKGMFENTKSGFRKSVGVGGGVTGSGADILLIDDPLNPEEAHSEADRATCIRWFKETLYSRLNNQDTGLRVVIMQRLHQEDLTGWITDNQSSLWRHICLPVSTDFEIKPPELKAHYTDGLFFPTRFTIEVIAQAKGTLGSYGYAGQMGQSPTPLGGGLIKVSWFKYFTEAPIFTQIFWSWDCAVKTGQQNDFSVGLKIGQTNTGFYVLEVLRGKWEYPELKRLVQATGGGQDITGVLVEDKSSGQQVIQDLKRDTDLNIIPFESDKDKIMRAQLVSPTIESGRVYLKDKAAWLPDFITEVSLFPNAKHDDQVDTLTQILLHLKGYVRPAMAYSGGGAQTPLKGKDDKSWKNQNQSWM
jgi:predicted phage terminase large subunit-like protein